MKSQTLRIKRRESIGGFTLVEVLIATVLIGLSIAALLAANGTLTMANGAGTDQSTAEFLAEQIRELTTMLPVVDPQTTTVTTSTPFGPEEASLAAYDDMDDFDGASFSPPIGADRTILSAFASFGQTVTVQNVDRANFDQVVADHGSQFVRVTVRILRNGREITSASWIRARY